MRGKYGLSVEQYREMVSATGGVCPICLRETRVWHIDHVHATGEVTGVICNPCNIGAVATSHHDPAFIRRLLAYVENPPAAKLGIQVPAQNRPSNLHAMWDRSRRGV